MKKILFLTLVLVLSGCAKKEEAPSRWFYLQRAYPHKTINPEAVKRARNQYLRLRRFRAKNMVWQLAGPTNIGGRVTAVAVNPLATNVIYIGTADGGVFKSIDNGYTWTPIFDNTGVLSIGAIAIDPQDTATIYVGTGEANSSGDSFDGNGIYVSHDGGMTWTHLGLDNTAHIGRIVINPVNDSIIYVAAMGRLFSTNPERGVYKSTDMGATWQRVLFVNDTTGCIDLTINPDAPDTVYAAMWQRIRGRDFRFVGGNGSGIYRSFDGGATWVKLTNGLPTGDTIGRIGIAVAPSSPNIIYAVFSDHPGNRIGIFKSTDGGNTWHPTGSYPEGTSYEWYFGNIRVAPTNPNIVYVIGLNGYISTDGGNSWDNFTNSIHVDHHDLWINSSNINHLVIGNDGGVYITTNGGASWRKCENLPITQFYDVAGDANMPQRVYGGTQDNGTIRTLDGGVNDWEEILGGDGFHVIVDYTNSNIIYAEWQYGNLYKSTDGGYSFNYATYGISYYDRRNWDTPVTMDPSNHNVLYYGTYRVYRTTNGAGRWYPISGDLTNGPGSGNLNFGTITVIEVAPSDSNYIYVGTDDGNVWVTGDYGSTWLHISDSLPDRYITDIAVADDNPQHVYISLSGYDIDEHTPHIFESTDAGTTWTDISGNLPNAPVNAIEIYRGIVIVGTDFGVYYRRNGEWVMLGDGLPPSVVMDLKLNGNLLIAGTHGRSAYVVDLSPLDVAENSIPSENPQIGMPITSNFLSIGHPEKVKNVEIFDTRGRLVIHTRQIADRINLGALPQGTYFARFYLKSGKVETLKFVKIQ